MSDESIILCPYCGLRQRFATGCTACGGRFDAWSLAATQNEMGAWFVRDSKRPHFVGCSHATIVAAIRAGEIGRDVEKFFEAGACRVARGGFHAKQAAGFHLVGFTVEGQAVGRIGDPVACGSSVAEGSPNVYAG